MSPLTGPRDPGGWDGPQHRGAMAIRREHKRKQAEGRNRRTAPEKRRVTREGPPKTRKATP